MKHAAALLAAAAALIGGAYAYAAEQEVTGIALLAAGLITLGVWLAIQAHHEHDDRKDSNDGR